VIKKLFLLVGVGILFVQTIPAVLAAEPVYDSVIRDFKSTIQVREDASLLIQEDLIVDSGTLQNKHGIFRSLPTKAPRERGVFDRTYIRLIDITDFNGNSRVYEVIPDTANNVITWKIGNPHTTIQGINNYRITYEVQNTVTTTEGGAEFYWNLSGNFWDLPINHYTADITFPDEINKHNTQLQILTGGYRSTSNDATFEWLDDNVLRIVSTRELAQREGITIKMQMPAGIITPYQPTWWELYGGYIWWLLLIPIGWLIWLIRCEMAKDEKKPGPITVQYNPPNKMLPLELGIFETKGAVIQGRYVSATIIDLAVKGYFKIEETQNKSFFGSSKDWKLVLLKNDFANLAKYEQTILYQLFNGVFEVGATTILSEHQNKFYKILSPIKKFVVNKLKEQGLFKSGVAISVKSMVSSVIGFIVFIGFTGLLNVSAVFFSLGFVLVGILIVAAVWYLFVKLALKKSKAGAEVAYHLKGFKLYLKQAEKHRMEFYEKENIFEKYLPYAIAFGLVGKWVEAFKKIYGEEKANSYIPIWYVGYAYAAGGGGIDSFASSINSVSSRIGSTLSSTPGGSGVGGGGGFSGGGGGGGGGGSW